MPSYLRASLDIRSERAPSARWRVLARSCALAALPSLVATNALAQEPGEATASAEADSPLDRLSFDVEWRNRQDATETIVSGVARVGTSFALFEPNLESGWRLDAAVGVGVSGGPYFSGGLELGYEWSVWEVGALALTFNMGTSYEEMAIQFPGYGCGTLDLGVCVSTQDVHDPWALIYSWRAELGLQHGLRARAGFVAWLPYSGVSMDGREVETNEIEVGMLGWNVGLIWRM